jgi:alpha 1,2-mannosyltransferase
MRSSKLVYGILAVFAVAFLTLIQSRGPASYNHLNPTTVETDDRENATFITLARNNDLPNLLESVRSVEDRFNHKFHYNWVFLNNEEFSEEFKSLMTQLISGNVSFGLIDKKHWEYPEWIDQKKAADSRKAMSEKGIIYGDNEAYRHMCRFESGFFFQHPLMQQYRYYWRVEPETSLRCDIDYDVFKYMKSNNKKYGWTISITEWEATIETLWKTVMRFVEKNPNYLNKNRLQEFLSNDDLHTYNLCHFWSNFEVADMDFWRGEAYQAFFQHLDRSGGFFYERWGDAPVHSIAAALFLDGDEIHFFDDIGYTHPPFTHCPANQVEKGLKCSCLPSFSFDWHDSSCLRTYLTAKNIPFQEVKPVDN